MSVKVTKQQLFSFAARHARIQPNDPLYEKQSYGLFQDGVALCRLFNLIFPERVIRGIATSSQMGSLSTRADKNWRMLRRSLTSLGVPPDIIKREYFKTGDMRGESLHPFSGLVFFYFMYHLSRKLDFSAEFSQDVTHALTSFLQSVDSIRALVLGGSIDISQVREDLRAQCATLIVEADAKEHNDDSNTTNRNESHHALGMSEEALSSVEGHDEESGSQTSPRDTFEPHFTTGRGVTAADTTGSWFNMSSPERPEVLMSRAVDMCEPNMSEGATPLPRRALDFVSPAKLMMPQSPEGERHADLRTSATPVTPSSACASHRFTQAIEFSPCVAVPQRHAPLPTTLTVDANNTSRAAKPVAEDTGRFRSPSLRDLLADDEGDNNRPQADAVEPLTSNATTECSPTQTVDETVELKRDIDTEAFLRRELDAAIDELFEVKATLQHERDERRREARRLEEEKNSLHQSALQLMQQVSLRHKLEREQQDRAQYPLTPCDDAQTQTMPSLEYDSSNDVRRSPQSVDSTTTTSDVPPVHIIAASIHQRLISFIGPAASHSVVSDLTRDVWTLLSAYHAVESRLQSAEKLRLSLEATNVELATELSATRAERCTLAHELQRREKAYADRIASLQSDNTIKESMIANLQAVNLSQSKLFEDKLSDVAAMTASDAEGNSVGTNEKNQLKVLCSALQRRDALSMELSLVALDHEKEQSAMETAIAELLKQREVVTQDVDRIVKAISSEQALSCSPARRWDYSDVGTPSPQRPPSVEKAMELKISSVASQRDFYFEAMQQSQAELQTLTSKYSALQHEVRHVTEERDELQREAADLRSEAQRERSERYSAQRRAETLAETVKQQEREVRSIWALPPPEVPLSSQRRLIPRGHSESSIASSICPSPAERNRHDKDLPVESRETLHSQATTTNFFSSPPAIPAASRNLLQLSSPLEWSEVATHRKADSSPMPRTFMAERPQRDIFALSEPNTVSSVDRAPTEARVLELVEESPAGPQCSPQPHEHQLTKSSSYHGKYSSLTDLLFVSPKHQRQLETLLEKKRRDQQQSNDQQSRHEPAAIEVTIF